VAVPRASGHARGRVSTLNRVLAWQEKEIIETALEECYGQVSGPIRRRHELGLPARTLDSKIKRFKINKYRFTVPRASWSLPFSPLTVTPWTVPRRAAQG